MRILEEELGASVTELFEELSPLPLASASLGQVLPLRIEIRLLIPRPVRTLRMASVPAGSDLDA